MKYVRIFWSLSIILLLCLVTACGKEETYGLGKHRTVVFKIDPLKITQSLGRNDYRLDSVCTLSFPDSMKYETTKILAKGNRIYVLDSRVGHTVYVFDSSGKYLFKLSERGRASYEYAGEPKDFFVDNMGMYMFLIMMVRRFFLLQKKVRYSESSVQADFFLILLD